MLDNMFSSTNTSAFSWAYQIAENSFTMFFDPQNIGLETCYTQLSLLLAELWRKLDFCYWRQYFAQ